MNKTFSIPTQRNRNSYLGYGQKCLKPMISFNLLNPERTRIFNNYSALFQIRKIIWRSLICSSKYLYNYYLYNFGLFLRLSFDYFGIHIVNILFLSGNVSRLTSYVIYNSQILHFTRCCTRIKTFVQKDCNNL